MKAFLKTVEQLRSHQIYLFYWIGEYYLNPAIAEQWEKIQENGIYAEEEILKVVLEILPARLSELIPGVYFPVPIARTVAKNPKEIAGALEKFFAPYIFVDHHHYWTWKNRPLEGKLKKFFLSNLKYEKPLELYYIEYWVENRWDKCYLSCEKTPLIGTLSENSNTSIITLTLNNGREDTALEDSFVMDQEERIFCQTKEHGLVQLEDSSRFRFLEEAFKKDGQLYIRWGQEKICLHRM